MTLNEHRPKSEMRYETQVDISLTRHVLNLKDQGTIILDQMPQDKWFTMQVKGSTNVISQEVRGWLIDPPQIADEP